MKKLRRQKYLTGSPIQGVIQNPQDAVVQEQIRRTKAQYEAEKNPWIMGLETVAGIGMGILGAKYGGGMGGGFGNMGGKQQQPVQLQWDLQNPNSDYRLGAYPGQRAAYGGIVQGIDPPRVKTTRLSKRKEKAYQEWRSRLPQNLQYEEDYDLRGLYKSDPNVQPSADLHFPDTYKLPNHPTFSDESIYFNDKTREWAGHWNQRDDGSTEYVPYNPKNKMPVREEPQMAYGGRVPQQVPIEAEGGELAQMPNGQMMGFQGPSHEQGGIDATLPEATKIYSNRISVDGVSMANRKGKREKRRVSLETLLAKNRHDALVENALNRTMQTNQKEEENDLQIQETIGRLLQEQEAREGRLDAIIGEEQAMGTGNKGLVKPPDLLDTPYNQLLMKYSKPIYNTPGNDSDYRLVPGTSSKTDKWLKEEKYWKDKQLAEQNDPKYRKERDAFWKQEEKNFQKRLDNYDVNNFNKYPDNGNNEYYRQIELEKLQQQLNQKSKFPYGTSYLEKNPKLPLVPMGVAGIPSPPNPTLSGEIRTKVSPSSLAVEPAAKQKNKKGNFFGNPTLGDLMGIAGNLYQGFAPYFNTLEGRSLDTPNINPYENYGKQGLQTMENAKGYIDQVTAAKMRELDFSTNAGIREGRNSAQGINTMRAMNLATRQGANRQMNEIYNNSAQQMLGLLGQQAGMQNEQDKMVMQGDYERDTNNRKDLDAFYTQLGQNKVDIGRNIAKAGEYFNDIKERNTRGKATNNMGKYIGINPMTGEYFVKPDAPTRGNGGNVKAEMAEARRNAGYEDDKEWNKLSNAEQNEIYHNHFLNVEKENERIAAQKKVQPKQQAKAKN